MDILKDCLNKIKSWTIQNSLKLNDTKTKFIQIKTKQSKLLLNELSILDQRFNCDDVAKNLGVIIDTHLCFNAQITDVCNKGFALIRQLWRISSKLNDITLKLQLVHACILSKIDYCNSIYFNLPLKQLKKLQRLLNASIRFIFNIKKRKVSITPFLKQAHILPVNLRIRYKMCVMVYKCVYNIAPQYLSSLLYFKTSLESLRVYNDTTLLYEPRLEKENYKNRKFEVVGPREWNVLPRSLREISSLETFKVHLKTFFFGKF